MGSQERGHDSIYLDVTGSSDISCKCEGGKDETRSILAYIYIYIYLSFSEGSVGNEVTGGDREAVLDVRFRDSGFARRV